MAVISDYTSLVAAVTEYLARDQDATLIARIPTFIQLAEAKMNRGLFVRQMEQRSIAVTDTTLQEPEFIALPTDFQSMRRIRITSVSGKPTLSFMSGQQIEEFRTYSANVAGQPQYFSIFGNELELAPTPDQAYTIEMIYRKNLLPVLYNSTNWLLTLAPDIYLYGTLMEAAPYMQNDERIQTWALGYKTALDELNELGKVSTFNAGPLSVSITGITP